MNLLFILLGSALILSIAYLTYGRLLSRLLRIDPHSKTPAHTMRDDLDYVPTQPQFLMSQHFSAIAAAGPIVGPILAGVDFGWFPALCWILVGAIFIGGVHDFTALIASVRHRSSSIAEVVREHMSRRSYILFLSFVWIALVYIIVAFTDITAAAFVGVQTLEDNQQVSGAGIATSSLLYLALPIIMGLLLRYTKLSLGWATIIFLPLVGVAIWVGQKIPLDLAQLLNINDNNAQKVWDVLLLGYCLIAAVVPVWLLLQPRGHLGGYFLYIALLGGAVGLIVGGQPIEYPSFIGWNARGVATGMPLFPILFITIACGACSGFHALIASGTTSKQLRCEPDARPIGYGTMLLEAMVAIVSLACVMVLAKSSSALTNPKPNFIYAQGIGSFLSALGISETFGVSFALMAFTTFVYDTLDVCTRLGRYIIQELTGLSGKAGRWLGTTLTAGVPLYFLLQPIGASGQPIWRTYWALFGASNQLLAALTLLGVTVWLWRTYRAFWVWMVTGIPAAWMYVMSIWALVLMSRPAFQDESVFFKPSPVPVVALLLIALAVAMLLEAILVIVNNSSKAPPKMPPAREPASVPA